MNRDAPVFYVKVSPKGAPGDKQERIDVTGRIRSLSFADDEKKADVLLLSVDNFDMSQIDSPFWKKGQVIEAAWGYAGSMKPTRECVIKKVAGRNPLRIEAHAKGVLLGKEVKSRTWDNQTRSEVVEKIAREHGYDGDRLHVQGTEEKHESITQARLTDAQFLKHLANKEGFEYFIDFDGFHWHERNLAQRPHRELIYYNDPGRGDVMGWSVDGDITNRPSSVKLRGRDPLRKKDIEAEANNQSTANRNRLGDVMEVIDKVTGESLGDRSINTAHDETLPTTETSEANAKRAATGRWKRAQMNTIKLNVDIVGDPDLVAKTVITLSGFGETLSGNYYISSLTDDISEAGYKQKLKLRRDSSSRGIGIDGTAGVPATGRKNDKATGKPGELTPIEVIDRITGQSKGTQYVDNRGRE